MSGRHTGGVKGTVQWRGYCPVCQRDVAGGNMSRPPGQQISLRPHKRSRVGTSGRANRVWCPGGGSLVAPDQALMREWADKLAAARAWRRVRSR